MLNKIEQFRQRKIGCLFSAALVFLFFTLVIKSAIESRWGVIFSGLGAMLLALIIWILWIIHLVWLLLRRPPVFGRRIPPWVSFLGGVLVFFVAFQVSGKFAGMVRIHEIQKAIDAGLRDDCMQLLVNWPVKDDRISIFDPEFSKLPSSIRMLEPVYVKNDIIDAPNDEPNVGLCKNGFGGFAMGVRVFKSDKEANKFLNEMQTTMQLNKDFGFQRIGPGVYFWWQNT